MLVFKKKIGIYAWADIRMHNSMTPSNKSAKTDSLKSH